MRTGKYDTTNPQHKQRTHTHARTHTHTHAYTLQIHTNQASVARTCQDRVLDWRAHPLLHRYRLLECKLPACCRRTTGSHSTYRGSSLGRTKSSCSRTSAENGTRGKKRGPAVYNSLLEAGYWASVTASVPLSRSIKKGKHTLTACSALET